MLLSTDRVTFDPYLGQQRAMKVKKAQYKGTTVADMQPGGSGPFA